jgi:hypothetical protein
VAAAAALEAVGGEAWFHSLLPHSDAAVGYVASLLLLTRLSHDRRSRSREQYHAALRELVARAQVRFFWPRPVCRYRRLRIQEHKGRGGLRYRFTVYK